MSTHQSRAETGHSHEAASESCCSNAGEKAASGCCGGKGGGRADGGCCQETASAVVLPAAAPPKVEAFFDRPVHEILVQYRHGIECFDRRIFMLDDAQLDTAFLPEAGVGRWPVRVLLGHLADAELVFVHRMRRAVGEENPVVALWDEDSFIDSGIYGRAGAPAAGHSTAYPIAGFVAVIHTLRRWHSEWLATLTPAQFERALLHPQRGAMTVRRVLDYSTWHLQHHAWYLNAKVTKMLGPDVADEAEVEGGCGSGCGCRH